MACVRGRLIDGVILLACLVPLLITAHLPLSDLPNHLARQFLLRDWATSSAAQTFYSYEWRLVPNLALELFVVAARGLVGVEMAVRLFCIATLVLLFAGTRTINLAVGEGRSRIYRAVPLLCYGGPFQFGFLSYCFGIGLCLLLFGLYLRWRVRSPAFVVAVFLAGSIALLLCHLTAFELFAIAVGAIELVAGWREGRALGVVRRQALAATFLVPPLLLFLSLSPTASDGKGIVWSSLQQKAESIVAITLFANPRAELLLLGVALACGAAALATRTVRVATGGVMLVGLMGLVWLAMPRSMLGGGYVDYRLPWTIAFFALAMLVPGARWMRFGRPLGAVMLVAAAARVALIAWAWIGWEPVTARIDAALSRLPVGARLMVVQGDVPSVTQSRQPSLLHVAAYAVARRQAFEPNLYASISGQMLEFTPEYRRLQQFTSPSRLNAIDPAYDHLLVIDPGYARLAPTLPLVRLDAGDRFALYRVGRR
ncbi:hypothetical protein ACBY01_06015 [Sphingomonas sp. ac-8]|uniref:hypothetical protein n=1 Tax=Sphingomonas sp. ac-8 TaxID=3242977 RepID=UPI003A7FF074